MFNLLTSLSIKNYALIEDISLDFTKGMTVITGETGAGKSIIIQSVDLLLGARAASSSIRTGASSCSVSAVFDISNNKHVQNMLEELAIESDNKEIIVRRQIDIAGKSKAFINDTAVNISSLYEIGRRLVDFYAQNKSNMLFDESYQRQIIDDIAGNKQILETLGEKYSCFLELEAKKKALMISFAERERLADLYNFQILEITKADLKTNDEILIESELPKLKNAEKIQNLTAEIIDSLYKSDNAVIDKLSKTIKKTELLGQLGIDTSAFLKTINDIYIQTDDFYREMNSVHQNTFINPETLNAMLEKQQLIKRLKSKYGSSIEEILKYKEDIEEKLKGITDYDSNIEMIEKQISDSKKELETLCSKISEKRKTVSKKLARNIAGELEELNMKGIIFEISVKKQEITRDGADKIEFMFCANSGENLYPLSEVASGGELSRVMLAIAATLSGHYNIPTVIFDEIDTGTSGQTSQKIGKKLKNISVHKQIILISHQAQIASNADSHIHIYKETINGRNITKAKILNNKEHIEEIAKIISGEKITEHALKHAKEMTMQ